MRAKLASLIELGKFRLSALAIFAVLAGLWLGSRVTPGIDLIISSTIGTLLVAMGGNALNMWIERELDSRMERTSGRPLPTGRVSAGAAMTVGIGSALAGLTILAIWTNWTAVALCGAIFVSYVCIYTPLKRITTLNTIVGAVPGALPPVVGYAAAGNGLDEGAWVLFLILFFWQIPHFLSISWRYREDYARSGMKMLPVVDPGGRSTAQQMLLYTAALVFVSLLPYGLVISGDKYLVVAVCLNFLFASIVTIAALGRFETAMRQAFFVSIIYLPLLLGAMVLDRTML